MLDLCSHQKRLVLSQYTAFFSEAPARLHLKVMAGISSSHLHPALLSAASISSTESSPSPLRWEASSVPSCNAERPPFRRHAEHGDELVRGLLLLFYLAYRKLPIDFDGVGAPFENGVTSPSIKLFTGTSMAIFGVPTMFGTTLKIASFVWRRDVSDDANRRNHFRRAPFSFGSFSFGRTKENEQ